LQGEGVYPSDQALTQAFLADRTVMKRHSDLGSEMDMADEDEGHCRAAWHAMDVDSEQDCYSTLRFAEKVVEVERDDAGQGNLMGRRPHSLGCYTRFHTHTALWDLNCAGWKGIGYAAARTCLGVVGRGWAAWKS
jgi:hypothetical protein